MIEETNKIIEKLLEIVPEEIQISFRKPTYITDYLSSKNTVTESNAFSTDIISRFGLYNSGYLESETDSDTYNKLERTESINWQGLQTKYTIFGGEAQNWISNYNRCVVPVVNDSNVITYNYLTDTGAIIAFNASVNTNSEAQLTRMILSRTN